jgi:hypothetical protein
MDYEKVFALAEPYLKKNDFGVPHTRRVFQIATENFVIHKELEELVFCSIIVHDIGGSTIQKQYTEGPKIAAFILRKLGYDESFVQQVCELVSTHHDHIDNPSEVFRILYDSDKLAMFSPEEYPHYNSKLDFNWNTTIDLIYSEHARVLARKLLKQRKNETTN